MVSDCRASVLNILHHLDLGQAVSALPRHDLGLTAASLLPQSPKKTCLTHITVNAYLKNWTISRI